jgi:hypothetical protein
VRTFAAALMLGLLLPQTAIAGPGDAPERGQAKRREGQTGTRRGGVEIGLGVLLTGTAGGLIAFGTVQLIRAREHVEFCRQGVTVIDELDSGGGIDPCVFDPPPLGFASAGLSWGFSIPLLVGGGMLFARAGRVIADARAHERLHVTVVPWWQRDGGGATLALRF